MYGKLFDSMYQGTLADNWQALITFQQMIVLCDQDGVIDVTPMSLSRHTGIPIEHIQSGIEALERPDPQSRTPDQEGRRIVRLDDHREWGWYIVNHEKYKTLLDAETVREQNRIRKQRQRKREAGLPDDKELHCAYCGKCASGPDHVIPKCLGGDESPENIVPACPKCNQHKAKRSVIEFINDPFVREWINIDLIRRNPILCRHVEFDSCHVAVTPTGYGSRHTDTDTDTDIKRKKNSRENPDHADESRLETSKKGMYLTGEKLSTFLQFWDAFDDKSRSVKKKAAKSWHEQWQSIRSEFESVILAAKFEAASRKAILAEGRTPKHAEGWITENRWQQHEYRNVCPQLELIACYESILPNHPRVDFVSWQASESFMHLQNIWESDERYQSLENWELIFSDVGRIPRLTGDNPDNKMASLSHIVHPKVFPKIVGEPA